MGLDSLRNIADMSGDPPGAPRQILDLVPGNRLENWEEIRNLRLEYDGPYLRLKRRGGTVSQRTFFGSINTIYPFSARINTVLKDFVAVHNTAGDIILWNVTDDTTSTVMTGFPTGEKIQITHSGIFLYAYSYDAGIAKYHDLEAGGEFNFLDYKRSYIETIDYRSNPLTEQNLWGFELDQQVIVFPNATWDSGVEIISSADGDGQLDYNLYPVNSFRYINSGGKFLIDSNGVEYRENRFFTFAPGDAPLVFTVGGSGADFTIEQFYIPLDEDGEPSFTSYVTKITSISDQYIGFNDPVGVPSSAKFGDSSVTEDITDRNLVFPYSPDLDDMVGRPANKKISVGGSGVVENGNYQAPSVYRAYIFLDVLNDGSVAIPGRPYELEATTNDLYQEGATGVRFTVASPDSHVARRFLCATRWQTTKRRAFKPSSELYPNSPYFIVREVDINKVFIEDNTPDDGLIRPITEQAANMTGGVFDQFGPGEMLPNSIASFQGALLTAGYQVNRPIPAPYTDPAAATDGNIFVDITQTTQLPNDMALAFQFEYPDGRRSEIVETEHFLQEGLIEETVAADCGQTKAFGSHTVSSGASSDGDVEVIYEGVTVTVPLTVASHSDPENTAEAIRQAVAAEPDILITPDVPSGSELQYTEKRFGEELNGNVVDVNNVLVAAEGSIDVSSNNLAATPAEGWIDVDANNLAAESSEPHQITIEGNTTGSITINDTDTLEQIVDKYVAEINGDATISADWTASKEDLGDGTWRCLIQSNINNESENGVAVSLSGDTDVTVVVESPTSGGSDGSESHTITVGANTTAAINITDADTVEDIVDKYVAEINGDATISADWTASKEDLGGGQWRVVTTSDTLGTSGNGTTIDVTESGVAEGSSDVDLSTSDASGGDDGPGVTFDNEDVTLSNAEDPQGTPAEAWIWPKSNNIPAGGQSETYVIEFTDSDGPHDSESTVITVDPGMSNDDILAEIESAFAGSTTEADWDSISIEARVAGGTTEAVVVVAGPPGQTGYNEVVFTVENDTGGDNVVFNCSAPGQEVLERTNNSAGATAGCLPASGWIDVDANSLTGGASEDHTITIDGNSTSAITINDTDTIEAIADKYISAIGAAYDIILEWKPEKVDNGDGTWRVNLEYRQYGTVGDGRSISVSGDSAVTTTVESPTSGGDDGGEVPSGSVEEVDANLLQIHSLNNLVSKIYVLGRIVDGATTFHLIQEASISDPEAHGMVLTLPDTQAALDDVESTIFTQSSSIREQVTLQNYVNVGVPFQEFPIPGQQSIQDQSTILRAMPLQFDVDKTQMRYKFLLVTDRNLQIAYLTDTGQGFNKDIETFYEGIRIKPGTRAGITLVEGNRVLMHTEDGIKLFDQNRVQKLIDDREYDLVKSGSLKTAILNRTHNEYWLIFDSQEVLAIDLEYEQAVKTFSFDGPGISANVREGAYAHNNMLIAIGGDLCYTDLEATHDDLGEGAANSYYINGQMISKHLGTPDTQKKILELDVGGQGYNVQAFLDLQKERLESNTNSWDKSFTEDVSTTVQALDISGTSFQFHKRAIMPKIKIGLTGDGDGFISHATLKYLDFENRGKARI